MPATPTHTTAREIILEIIRNMREGLEPLHYSTLAPAIYNVYIHADDLDRLRGILPRILDEARKALDEEVAALNRGSLSERLKIVRRTEPKIAPPEGGWQIRILENTDDDVDPGDIVIYSELALPGKPEYGAGSMTKRIATRRLGGAFSSSSSYDGVAPGGPAGSATLPPTKPLNPESTLPPGQPAADLTGALAVIEYEDRGGRKLFRMTKEQIVVGRGGRDYWTDLKLDTLPDVSREHFRLRRDAEGKFFLKDLSRLGTTINGEAAPCSLEIVDGEKRDRNLEVPVPEKARIGLAGVLYLEFRSIA
ncbi:MAG TPA: FHA domain-containing protein [Verrucomicrobiae bacterium]|nr:FHA domain-containing protein [Verrucomicrobiae bacterium]